MEHAVAKIRQRHQGSGGRQHLPRRHAVEELRRHAQRQRWCSTTTTNRVPHRLQLPPRCPHRNEEDELSAKFVAASPHDVFPKPSAPSLLGNRRRARPSCATMRICWTWISGSRTKARIQAGHFMDVFPTGCISALAACRFRNPTQREIITMSQHQDPVVIVQRRPHAQGRLHERLRDGRPTWAARHQGQQSGAPASPAGQEVLFGNCLMAGQGQAPARQALFRAAAAARAVTLSKMCGSGMATIPAHDQLIAGAARVMVSGGMESMMAHPTCCRRAAAAAAHGPRQRCTTTRCSTAWKTPTSPAAPWHLWRGLRRQYQFTREHKTFAIASVTACAGGRQNSAFDAEIAPVTVRRRKGEVTVSVDTEARPRSALDKIPQPQARLQEGQHHHRSVQFQHQRQRHTMVLMRESTPAAGLQTAGAYRQPYHPCPGPEWFSTAPLGATERR